MNSDRHGRGGMRTCLGSLLKSNRFLPGGLLSRATFSAAAPFPMKRAEAGKCRQRGRPRLGQSQVHTASFIRPSHVVKDVNSGERVRKAVSEGI